MKFFPLDNPYRPAALMPRLLGAVKSFDDCWEWTRSTDRGGYGQIYFRGRNMKAHALSYWVHKGPIAEGLHVLHRCDNPCCINPEHLFLGSQPANMRDMVQKKRHAHGATRGWAILTEETVREIRRSNQSNSELARKLGVNRSTVSTARSGKSWSHIQ